MTKLKHFFLQSAGWLFYLSLLMGLALMLPTSTFDSESKDFIFLIGAVGIWRYSMGATHFVRGMIFSTSFTRTCVAKYASWVKRPIRRMCF